MTNQPYCKRLAVLGMLFVVCVPSTLSGETAVSRTDYDAHWTEAVQALAEFASADLSRKAASPTELNALYRSQSTRYADALAWIAQHLPPADAMQAHWQLLPRHEQVLAAMRIICDSNERNDEPRRLSGWIAFRKAVASFRSTAETLSK